MKISTAVLLAVLLTLITVSVSINTMTVYSLSERMEQMELFRNQLIQMFQHQ